MDEGFAIRAERRAPHLTADESALLARINQGLPQLGRVRMNELIAKRDQETSTHEEMEELIALTDRLEVLHADRLAALLELANLKGITFDDVINQLAIQFPAHY